MSLPLMLLSSLLIAIASLALIRPALLFVFPVAASLLMAMFLLPQAWAIERTGALNDFEPTLTWNYMLLCIVATVAGYVASQRQAKPSPAQAQANGDFFAKYDVNRLFQGAVVLVLVGGVAFTLMYREAAKLQVGQAWSGPIALYALLAGLMLFGASLAWLLYLYKGDKRCLVLALIGFSGNIPAVFISARRELTFTLATVILLGFFFAKRKTISRVLLIPLVVFGGVLVSQAGAIRTYIATNDSNLVEALTTREVLANERENYTELGGGVSDVAIANWSGEYSFFTPYINTLVQLYVPAFIVGKDVKDSLKSDGQNEFLGRERYTFMGATRTGFGDSFLSFHYFGCAVFALIAYIMGILWRNARAGAVQYQLYYMLVLGAALKTFTESTAVFFGSIPFIIGSTSLLFWYARKHQQAAPARMPSFR